MIFYSDVNQGKLLLSSLRKTPDWDCKGITAIPSFMARALQPYGMSSSFHTLFRPYMLNIKQAGKLDIARISMVKSLSLCMENSSMVYVSFNGLNHYYAAGGCFLKADSPK